MKKRLSIAILLLVLLDTFTNTIWHGDRVDEMKILNAKLDRIEQQIKHRSKLDSLYWNHLEECAFELKEGVNYTEKN